MYPASLVEADSVVTLSDVAVLVLEADVLTGVMMTLVPGLVPLGGMVEVYGSVMVPVPV